ncbi:MAG: SH3 domain-containing protein [Bilophila sp.]
MRPTVLREAPTHRPRFSDPSKAGQGYPFDLFQYSALPVGMPLLVLHESADGAWLYVETGLVAGWVPASDTALTDGAFRSRYKNGSYAVIVRDDVPLRDRAGRYVTTGHLGTMLPVLSTSGSTLTLLVPVRDTQGRAVAVASPVAASDAVLKPLPLTPEAVARLGNVMMGQPYGWGGYLQDRDCSQAMRDLFVPLASGFPAIPRRRPRHGASSASSTPRLRVRKASSKRKACPLPPSCGCPGHITLYLGTYKGQPVMFHDMWGIRTEERGREGRHIIGRAVVTSLRPGAELADVRKDNLLLARMRGMSVLRYE